MSEEKIAQEAIAAWKTGKGARELQARYPEQKELIADVFALLESLREQGERAKPPRELLSKTLDKIQRQEAVTNQQEARYIYQNKGRLSFQKLTDQISASMNSTFKLLIGAGVLALILVVAFGVARRGEKEQIARPPAAQEQITGESAQETLAQTKDVDEILAILGGVVNAEESAAQGAGGDTGLLDDAAERGDSFGQQQYEL